MVLLDESTAIRGPPLPPPLPLRSSPLVEVPAEEVSKLLAAKTSGGGDRPAWARATAFAGRVDGKIIDPRCLPTEVRGTGGGRPLRGDCPWKEPNACRATGCSGPWVELKPWNGSGAFWWVG